jgi:hypothetical protein
MVFWGVLMLLGLFTMLVVYLTFRRETRPLPDNSREQPRGSHILRESGAAGQEHDAVRTW